MKRFSDFAEEQTLDGDKVKLDDVLNKEIVVTGYVVTKSKYKSSGDMYLKLQFEVDGARYILFTGSNVLINQIERYHDEIPFITTIKKVDKFYTFS